MNSLVPNIKRSATANARGIPGQEKVSPVAVAEARYFLENFERGDERRFDFERIIGEGSFGVTLKMKMRDKLSPMLELKPVRRFVMKRSLNQQGRENVQREIAWIRTFQGAIHISQPFNIDEKDPKDTLSYLSGPTLCLEWIDNGLLYNFIERVGDWGHPLPNRLLWRLFLCLCRFVVALAWPPQKDRTATPEIEFLPTPNEKGDRPPKSRIIHGDLHSRNIMIHNFEPREHEKVPMLKLIDFGMARELRDVQNVPDAAVKTNILDIGKTMLPLLGGSHHGGVADMTVTDDQGNKNTIKSYARDLDGMNPAYRAPAAIVARHREKMDNLDADLKNLVALCCASSANDRPGVEYLVGEVERNVNTKQQSDYIGRKYAFNESDEAISRIVREVVLDAKKQDEIVPTLSLQQPSLTTYGGFGPGPGPPPPPPPPPPGAGGAGGYTTQGYGYDSYTSGAFL